MNQSVRRRPKLLATHASATLRRAWANLGAKRVRKAFVHVGMPKTGTTAIQVSLSEARLLLKESGVLYPGNEPDHAALTALFHQCGPQHYYFQARNVPPEESIISAERILNEVDRSSSLFDSVVISSEYLYNMDERCVECLSKFLSERNYEVYFVCYVRHPIGMATSAAQQNIKMGSATLAEMIFFPRWHSLIETLEAPLNVLGREKVIVRRFEDARASGTERDLLQCIGFRGDLDRIPRREVNSSISYTAALLADAHTKLAKDRPELNRLRGYLLRIGGPKFFLPPETIDIVRKGAQRELEWLEEKFGITLPEPEISEAVEHGALTETAALDIVAELLRGEHAS